MSTPTTLTDLSPHFSKWEARRREADIVTEVLRAGIPAHQVRADRMAQCTTFLQLHPFDTADGRQHWIAHTRRCRDRLCPICQIGRTGWWKVRLKAALRQLLTDSPDAVGIALTFTVRNCTIIQLRDTLRWMSKSWAAMIRRPPWPEHYGWLRVTEVTRGNDDTAHPHYHVLLLVSHRYFESAAYLNQDQWTALWQRFLKVPYRPRVDVRRVKSQDLHTAVGIIERGQRQQSAPDLERRDRVRDSIREQNHQPSDERDAWHAVSRVLDYNLKPDDLVALRQEPDWFLSLAEQLYRLRTIEVGGTLRKTMAPVTKALRQEWQRTHATVQQKQGTGWVWQQKDGYVKAYGADGQTRRTVGHGAERQRAVHSAPAARTRRAARQLIERGVKRGAIKTTGRVTPAWSGALTGTTPRSNSSKQTIRKAGRSHGSRTGQQ